MASSVCRSMRLWDSSLATLATSGQTWSTSGQTNGGPVRTNGGTARLPGGREAVFTGTQSPTPPG